METQSSSLGPQNGAPLFLFLSLSLSRTVAGSSRGSIVNPFLFYFLAAFAFTSYVGIYCTVQWSVFPTGATGVRAGAARATRASSTRTRASSASTPATSEMPSQLYDPAARAATYGGNHARYLLDLDANAFTTFNFCGGMMFGVSLSPPAQGTPRGGGERGRGRSQATRGVRQGGAPHVDAPGGPRPGRARGQRAPVPRQGGAPGGERRGWGRHADSPQLRRRTRRRRSRTRSASGSARRARPSRPRTRPRATRPSTRGPPTRATRRSAPRPSRPSRCAWRASRTTTSSSKYVC